MWIGIESIRRLERFEEEVGTALDPALVGVGYTNAILLQIGNLRRQPEFLHPTSFPEREAPRWAFCRALLRDSNRRPPYPMRSIAPHLFGDERDEIRRSSSTRKSEHPGVTLEIED